MFDGVDTYQYRREKNNDEQPVKFNFPTPGWGDSRKAEREHTTGSGMSPGYRSVLRFGFKELAGMALMLLTGFLLSRAVLLGELFPFGPAFVAAGIATYRGRAWPVFLGAAMGLYLVNDGWEIIVRLTSLALIGMAALSLSLRTTGLWFLLGGAVFAVLVIMGTGYVALTTPSNYEYIRVLFDSIFGALLAVAFLKALTGLGQIARREQVAAGDMFCMVLLLSCLVAAAGQLQWNYISPGGILAGLVVLVAGYIGGGGLGASAGAIMGVLPGLVYTISPAAAGAAAFAGLLAGVCRVMGRTGVVAGFLMGSILLTVYLGSGRDILGVLGESVVAVLAFFLLPGVFLNGLRNYLPTVQPWGLAGGDDEAAKETNPSGRLRRWNGMFEEIAHTYKHVGGVRETENYKTGRRDLVAELKEMVCAGCPLQRVCWDKEFELTKSTLEYLKESMKRNEKVKPADLDQSFAERCSRAGEIIVGMNCLYQLHRVKQHWENCLRDSREMVFGHLRGMNGVVGQLVLEAEAEKDNWIRRAEYLKRELKQADLAVSELVLYPGSRGCEVEVTMLACKGLKKCRYDVTPLLSRLTGQNLAPAFTDCICPGGENFCFFRLYPDLKHGISLGLSRLAARNNTVSGDTHAVVQLSGGRLAIMLSDGMGSGSSAAAESGATIKLIKQLLRAGYGAEPAIRTVNSVMMGREPEDSFATLDILEIDLYSRQAKLIKIGAAPGFWVRGDKVEIIRSHSLPVGIVNEISTFSRHEKLAVGDLLVMVTDGIIDAHRETDENEDWVASVLGEIIDLPPGEVAELLVKLARGGENGHVLDDMTVLAIRVGGI